MKENFDKAFDLVMKSEGGYVWDRNDAGGETNLGVTRKAWGAYLGRPVQDGEMKLLTREVVKPFYEKCYWAPVRGDQLPTGLDYAAFDFAVNAGPGQAARFIQRAAGTAADGVIGPATLGVVQKADPEELLKKFSEEKEHFYKGIVERKPDQAKFLNGWLARVEHVHTTAESMIS